MNLAPIGIITYSRIEHLRKTIDSLKRNELSKQSDLFIFIDGAKEGDEDKVNVIKEYSYSVGGFKKVHVNVRDINNRLDNYFIGIGGLLRKYGKVIFLEDDNIVSSGFLKYMNDGLDFYKGDKSIVAISGYNVPMNISDEYKYDYYLSCYFNAWGYATWNDRATLEIEKNNDQYSEIINDKELFSKVKNVHPKLIDRLKLIRDGKLNAGDFRLTYYLIKYNKYVVRPMKSVVDNIGHDGSGLHCVKSNMFDHAVLSDAKIIFYRNVKYKKEFDKLFYNFFNPKNNFFLKIFRKLKK
ncbi:MAG: hypothetical protein GQ532_06430 [Methylomarinum sp.]|nr:hypothetical protein [Methylomarinum sp.]